MGSIFDNNMVHLPMGEVIVAKGTKVLWTVLGSCIAVTLYDKRTKMGAMCHAQLSKPNKKNHSFNPTGSKEYDYTMEADNRFASNAIRRMLTELHKRNVNLDNIETRVYGGASILNITLGGVSVGKRNSDFTQEFLATFNITPNFVDVGGDVGRKVKFDLSTGEVIVEYQRQNGTNEQLRAK